MYKPEHFTLQEFLPKVFYENNFGRYGDMLWIIFDERLLWTYDQLRERYGRVTMNDWLWGGSNQYRGWRPLDCLIGAKISQHKFGRAGDGIFKQPAEEIRQDILKYQKDEMFQYITVIEKDVSWLHIDCRNSRYGNDIKVI